MPSWLLIILISVSAVTIFVVGMSLTLIIKGRHIDSEIATNKNMQKLGIKCTVHEAMEEGRGDCAPDAGCTGDCTGCETTKKRN